jgi:hypothetical protein
MSQENVEIVRRVYEASLRSETERVIEMLDPAIRLDMSERVFNPINLDEEAPGTFVALVDGRARTSTPCGMGS